ncbi:MAG: helix-turn-helix domain-containing protein [Defluviitaleaceae bacterium]|nr:helix-turn-helix domain-containing protein [Defluviitaleaceae bacterium]
MIDETNKEIGRRIQNLRKSAGLSEDRLAELLEIPVSFLGFTEDGKCNPPIKILMGISNILNVSLDYIAFEENE